ncbi:unnamed protein product, partial [Notodromas monacha]
TLHLQRGSTLGTTAAFGSDAGIGAVIGNNFAGTNGVGSYTKSLEHSRQEQVTTRSESVEIHDLSDVDVAVTPIKNSRRPPRDSESSDVEDLRVQDYVEAAAVPLAEGEEDLFEKEVFPRTKIIRDGNASASEKLSHSSVERKSDESSEIPRTKDEGNADSSSLNEKDQIPGKRHIERGFADELSEIVASDPTAESENREKISIHAGKEEASGDQEIEPLLPSEEPEETNETPTESPKDPSTPSATLQPEGVQKPNEIEALGSQISLRETEADEVNSPVECSGKSENSPGIAQREGEGIFSEEIFEERIENKIFETQDSSETAEKNQQSPDDDEKNDFASTSEDDVIAETTILASQNTVPNLESPAMFETASESETFRAHYEGEITSEFLVSSETRPTVHQSSSGPADPHYSNESSEGTQGEIPESLADRTFAPRRDGGKSSEDHILPSTSGSSSDDTIHGDYLSPLILPAIHSTEEEEQIDKELTDGSEISLQALSNKLTSGSHQPETHDVAGVREDASPVTNDDHEDTLFAETSENSPEKASIVTIASEKLVVEQEEFFDGVSQSESRQPAAEISDAPVQENASPDETIEQSDNNSMAKASENVLASAPSLTIASEKLVLEQEDLFVDLVTPEISPPAETADARLQENSSSETIKQWEENLTSENLVATAPSPTIAPETIVGQEELSQDFLKSESRQPSAIADNRVQEESSPVTMEQCDIYLIGETSDATANALTIASEKITQQEAFFDDSLESESHRPKIDARVQENSSSPVTIEEHEEAFIAETSENLLATASSVTIASEKLVKREESFDDLSASESHQQQDIGDQAQRYALTETIDECKETFCIETHGNVPTEAPSGKIEEQELLFDDLSKSEDHQQEIDDARIQDSAESETITEHEKTLSFETSETLPATASLVTMVSGKLAVEQGELNDDHEEAVDDGSDQTEIADVRVGENPLPSLTDEREETIVSQISENLPTTTTSSEKMAEPEDFIPAAASPATETNENDITLTQIEPQLNFAIKPLTSEAYALEHRLSEEALFRPEVVSFIPDCKEEGPNFDSAIGDSLLVEEESSVSDFPTQILEDSLRNDKDSQNFLTDSDQIPALGEAKMKPPAVILGNLTETQMYFEAPESSLAKNDGLFSEEQLQFEESSRPVDVVFNTSEVSSSLDIFNEGKAGLKESFVDILERKFCDDAEETISSPELVFASENTTEFSAGNEIFLHETDDFKRISTQEIESPEIDVENVRIEMSAQEDASILQQEEPLEIPTTSSSIVSKIPIETETFGNILLDSLGKSKIEEITPEKATAIDPFEEIEESVEATDLDFNAVDDVEKLQQMVLEDSFTSHDSVETSVSLLRNDSISHVPNETELTHFEEKIASPFHVDQAVKSSQKTEEIEKEVLQETESSTKEPEDALEANQGATSSQKMGEVEKEDVEDTENSNEKPEDAPEVNQGATSSLEIGELETEDHQETGNSNRKPAEDAPEVDQVATSSLEMRELEKEDNRETSETESTHRLGQDDAKHSQDAEKLTCDYQEEQQNPLCDTPDEPSETSSTYTASLEEIITRELPSLTSFPISLSRAPAEIEPGHYPNSEQIDAPCVYLDPESPSVSGAAEPANNQVPSEAVITAENLLSNNPDGEPVAEHLQRSGTCKKPDGVENLSEQADSSTSADEEDLFNEAVQISKDGNMTLGGEESLDGPGDKTLEGSLIEDTSNITDAEPEPDDSQEVAVEDITRTQDTVPNDEDQIADVNSEVEAESQEEATIVDTNLSEEQNSPSEMDPPDFGEATDDKGNPNDSKIIIESSSTADREEVTAAAAEENVEIQIEEKSVANNGELVINDVNDAPEIVQESSEDLGTPDHQHSADPSIETQNTNVAQ